MMTSWGAGTFPFFSILEEYDPDEAFELRGQNRFPLLILDHQFFPMFMDWALSCSSEDGTGDLVLFLSEADSFRFNTALRSNHRQGIDIKRLQKLLLNVPSFLEHGEGHRFLSIAHQVTQMGLSMPALFDASLQFLWNEYVKKGQRIHTSSVWNSIKKKIHAEVSIDLYSIIGDDHYCMYFQTFLSSNEQDVLCLECWKNVRHVIATLQVLKIPDPSKSSHSSSSGSRSSSSSSSKSFGHALIKDEGQPDLLYGSGTSSTHFTKPYEALEVMLACVVKYHEYIVRRQCSGVTKDTRLTLIDVMEKNKSIRGQIKSLDLQFTLKLCNSIEDLFFAIEKETFFHLNTDCFERFVGADASLPSSSSSASSTIATSAASPAAPSNEYVALLSSIRLKSSANVKFYLRKLAFLQEVQRGKRFPWRTTGNCLFVSYASHVNGATSRGDTNTDVFRRKRVAVEKQKKAFLPHLRARPRTTAAKPPLAPLAPAGQGHAHGDGNEDGDGDGTTQEEEEDEDEEDEGVEILIDSTVHCEACHVSFQPPEAEAENENEAANSLPSPPLSLCDRCLPSFLPTPCLAVELHMTVETQSSILKPDSDSGSSCIQGETSSTKNTPSFKYKYRPPTGASSSGLPVCVSDSPPPVAAVKNTLKIEQHCWAAPACSEIALLSDVSSKPTLCLSLLNANYYEIPFSEHRKKSVRFVLPAEKTDDSRHGSGKGDSEGDSEGEGEKCAGTLCKQLLAKCVEEVFTPSSFSSHSSDGSNGMMALEARLAEMMREAVNSAAAGDDVDFPREVRTVTVSNNKNLLAAFDSYSRSTNKLSFFRDKQARSDATPTLDSTMMYISCHKKFINGSTCILTFALSPYPLLKTLNDIVEAILKTRNIQNSLSSEVKSNPSTDISMLSSAFSTAVLRANLCSSRAKLCEWFGSRENFLEFYRHTSPVHSGSSGSSASDNSINNNSRKQFCDFSMIETVSAVSVRMVALLIMELARNRSVVVHSFSQEKVVQLISCLLALLHPLEIQKYFRITTFSFSSAEDISAWISSTKATAMLAGCCTKVAIKLKNNITAQNADRKKIAFFDLDNDMTLYPDDSAYGSVSNNRLLNIPPEKELKTLIKDFQKCCLLNKKMKQYSSRRSNSNSTPDVVDLTSWTFNFYMQSIFKSFLNGILLKNIPASLNLYPSRQVVSCDVAGLMQRTLADSNQPSSQHSSQSSSRSHGVAEFVLLSERKRFMEQVVETPSFADFLARHGFALHFFQ